MVATLFEFKTVPKFQFRSVPAVLLRARAFVWVSLRTPASRSTGDGVVGDPESLLWVELSMPSIQKD